MYLKEVIQHSGLARATYWTLLPIVRIQCLRSRWIRPVWLLILKLKQGISGFSRVEYLKPRGPLHGRRVLCMTAIKRYGCYGKQGSPLGCQSYLDIFLLVAPKKGIQW